MCSWEDPRLRGEGVGRAMELSPLDPLVGPMLSVRALSLLIDGRLEEAQSCALRSTRAGPAHVINAMGAAAISALCGRNGEANRLAAWVRNRRPDATVELYLKALPMAEGPVRDQLVHALLQLGFIR